MTQATPADVAAALLRDLEEDEAKYVQAALDYVEALIVTRVPDAIARATQDEHYRIILVRVESEAVARLLRAPGGGLYKYETEGTYTYSVNSAVASGLLEITDAEWLILGGVEGPYGTLNFTGDGYLKTRTNRALIDRDYEVLGTEILDEDDILW